MLPSDTLPDVPSTLQPLLQQGKLWRGADRNFQRPAVTAQQGIASGFPSLDEALPFAGWPRGALTEILLDNHGAGELELLMPALAQTSQQKTPQVWVAPPFLPYAPALQSAGIDLTQLLVTRCKNTADQLWSIEQSLHTGAMVLGWPDSINTPQLRRLQLAAANGQTAGFLFRPLSSAQSPSPAALRLQVEREGQFLKLRIIKCRGRFFSGSIRLKILTA